MSGRNQLKWVVDALAPLGMDVEVVDDRGDMVATAGWRVDDVPSTLTVALERSSEGAMSRSLLFEAPGFASVPPSIEERRRGAVPAQLRIAPGAGLSDSFGGVKHLEDLPGLIAFGAFRWWRRRRADRISPEHGGAPAPAMSPEGLLPDDLAERLATWCTMYHSELTVSEWRCLQWAGWYGDNGLALRRQMALWNDVVRVLAESGQVALRDPASIVPPSKAEVDASLKFVRDQLRAMPRTSSGSR
jgi:hypothetical protein